MKSRIKILFFGYDYFGGQFLQTILEDHSDKFEVVGISTNVNVQALNFNKKIRKLKVLFKKRLVISEYKEKVFFDKMINRDRLKNNPPVYPDIKVKILAERHNIAFIDSFVVYAGVV